MSFRVLVVPEDPTNNGYILRPLVTALLSACGKPNALVTVLTNPRTQGYHHAKNQLRNSILARYRYYDLVLFLPDADGLDRSADFAELEAVADSLGTVLVCCAAVQELETWLLAGHVERLNESWPAVRADVSVKENYFQPFMKQHGDTKRPGSGRENLMNQTVANYRGLKTRCPEIQALEDRVARLLNRP